MNVGLGRSDGFTRHRDGTGYRAKVEFMVDTRSIKRDSLFLMAQVRLYGRAASDKVKVRNLSNTGIMVEGELLAEVGQRVIVTLRNVGEVGGTVAWTQSARVGIAFDEPIEAARARKHMLESQSEAPRYARPAVHAPYADNYRKRSI